MKLDEVVPWGRSLAEYQAMFNLSEADLNKHILSCADGPASFNAELSTRGGHVTSVDPIYQFSLIQLEQRIVDVTPKVINQVISHQQDFNWDFYTDVDTLYQHRIKSMTLFLNDFEQGKQQNRYQVGALPSLNYEANRFDIALCSHFLFLYSEHHDLAFHIQAISALCHVAIEVRIYPLVTLQNNLSPHLNSVIDWLKSNDYKALRQPVSYTFQKGATEMLLITKN